MQSIQQRIPDLERTEKDQRHQKNTNQRGFFEKSCEICFFSDPIRRKLLTLSLI
jgi:hypothetical protein